jgi:hypothetical protein
MLFILLRLCVNTRTVTRCPVTFLVTVTGRSDTFLDGVDMGRGADHLSIINQPIRRWTQGALLDKTVERGAGNPQRSGRLRFGMFGHGAYLPLVELACAAVSFREYGLSCIATL